jgi:endonuclease YncB( thermonuclease family)
MTPGFYARTWGELHECVQIASRLVLILVSLGLPTACAILVTSPLIAQVAQRGAIQGIGEAKDGDTIQVGNTTIRLVGIDAPELGQVCQNKSGNSYPCGKNAKTKLQDLLVSHHLGKLSRCLEASRC